MHEGGCAVEFGGVDVFTFFYEKADGIGAATSGSVHKDARAVVVGGVNVGAFFHEQAGSV